MKRSASVSRVLCAAAFAALALAVVVGQQAAPQAAPVFTAAQAQAGRAFTIRIVPRVTAPTSRARATRPRLPGARSCSSGDRRWSASSSA